MIRIFLLLMTIICSWQVHAEGAPTYRSGSAEIGKEMATAVCAACHGVTGNAVGVNPSLAGQHERFLYAQLQAFKSGIRKNPIMAGMVANLTDVDMRNLAAYFAQQTPLAQESTEKDRLSMGEKIYRQGLADRAVPACMACHSPEGKGIDPVYPRLGSQNAAYVYNQLKAYQLGVDRINPVMADVAKKLTDEEMKAVAAYINGLR
jgi:cytochrome c553